MKDYSTQLLKKYRAIVNKYCRLACTEVRQQWGAIDTIDGEASIEERDIQATQDTVARAICAYGQKAWVAEFGRGSLMDKSTAENPFLQDYLSDPYFNRDRLGHGLAIVGRPHGYYPDIDGNPHFSHGALEGKVIETWYGQTLFAPIRGQHIISNILNKSGLLTDMDEEIQNATMDVLYDLMSTFPKEIKIC